MNRHRPVEWQRKQEKNAIVRSQRIAQHHPVARALVKMGVPNQGITPHRFDVDENTGAVVAYYRVEMAIHFDDHFLPGEKEIEYVARCGYLNVCYKLLGRVLAALNEVKKIV